MLITKNIKVKVTKINILQLINYKYVVKLKDVININILHLSKNSNKIVDVSCDICKKIYNMKYQTYNKQMNSNDKLYCNECKSIKIKETKQLRYGDSNFNNIKKIKETCLEKYGVNNVSKIEKIKEKIKETCLEKYGETTPLKNKEIKEKIKETCLEKYGVDNISKNNNIKKKKKKTCLDNFGVENPFQSKEIKEKIKETCLEKYGVDNISKNEEIKEKKRLTCFNNYNKEYYTQTIEYLERTGKILPENKTEYQKYRHNVNNIINKMRKNIIENWNGYDYYDGEYIKDNLNLCHNNENYPTIDHKISVSYAFLNKISEEEICNISNICITKRKINSSKNKNNEIDYKKKMKKQ